MSLFVCDECGAVDNTALTRYNMTFRLGDARALCSECDPEIGVWHNAFPKEPWDGLTPVVHVSPNDPRFQDIRYCRRCGQSRPVRTTETCHCGEKADTLAT